MTATVTCKFSDKCWFEHEDSRQIIINRTTDTGQETGMNTDSIPNTVEENTTTDHPLEQGVIQAEAEPLTDTPLQTGRTDPEATEKGVSSEAKDSTSVNQPHVPTNEAKKRTKKHTTYQETTQTTPLNP